MKRKKMMAVLMCSAMLLSVAACGSQTDLSQTAAQSEAQTAQSSEAESAAEDTDEEMTGETEEIVSKALVPFEETVTLHLGKGIDPSVVSFDEDESIEDNRYLRWIREDLNIAIEYDWICSSSDFSQKMNLCIAGNTLPDAMSVDQTQYLAMLKYDQLQPLTDVFNEYASDMLKQYVLSGGEALIDAVSKDGEMYAIPAPNLTAGSVTLMWIRQDWLDELELDVPTTVEDVEAVAKAFVDNKMGGENTIGIVGPSSNSQLIQRGGNYWGLEPIFSAYQAYPEYWLKNENNEVIYGSVQPETREALEKLAEMYSEGILDTEVFVRSDSKEPVVAGQVGIFFATCSAYPLSSVILSGSADWHAYLAPLSADGNFYSPMADATNTYVCISKDCEEPGAVIQLINYLIANEQKWVSEGTANETAMVYPIYSVFDNADEMEYSYEWMKKVNDGEAAIEDVDVTGRKLLANDLQMLVKLKLEPKDDFSIEYWDLENELAAANMPRLFTIMVGVKPIVEDTYIPVTNIYSGQTDTMTAKWANLEKLESETFAKIILGQASIEEFDTFVEKWYAEGGQEILNEISEIVGD